MSTDWQEKEREFLIGLEADSGRDLAEWMRVIAAQNLPHRNDIIDWLRQQGFMFSRASWLERIHHNGGRPIYCDPADLLTQADGEEMVARRVAGGGTIYTPANPASPEQRPRQSEPQTPHPQVASVAAEQMRVRTEPAPLPPVPVHANGATAPLRPDAAAGPTTAAAAVAPGPLAPVAPTAPASSTPSPAESPAEGLDDVLARAKAYRPLAQHLLRLIETSVPGVDVNAAATHLTLALDGRPFGLLVVSPKDVRLVLRLAAERAKSAHLRPLKLLAPLARAAEGMSHMAVLTDARQLDSDLVNLVRASAGL